MITNSSLTIYHKTINETTLLEEWTRINIERVWWFGGKGASINKGYENANDVDIRIPDNQLNINDIAIGDILVKGTLTTDITKQQDLNQKEVYNIKSIINSDFGNNPHIYIGGR